MFSKIGRAVSVASFSSVLFLGLSACQTSEKTLDMVEAGANLILQQPATQTDEGAPENTAESAAEKPEEKAVAVDSAALHESDISKALKQALDISVKKVIANLGKSGAFAYDDAIRIRLPQELEPVHNALSQVSLGGMTAKLERRLNEAAEKAVPKVQDIFLGAIRQMSIADARAILTGNNDAATLYLRGKAQSQLEAEIKPIVTDSLNNVGVARLYKEVMANYRYLPFAPDIEVDLNQHVTEKAIDGIFYYIASEEEKIRKNPVARTTDLLKAVFGAR